MVHYPCTRAEDILPEAGRVPVQVGSGAHDTHRYPMTDIKIALRIGRKDRGMPAS